jgi:hypothetical protein
MSISSKHTELITIPPKQLTKYIPLLPSFILPPSLKSLPYSNLFYYSSLVFMWKLSHNYLSKTYTKLSKQSQLKSILTQLKTQYVIPDQSTSSLEIIYYIYFKCLNEVYEEEIKRFKNSRRFFLKSNRLYDYIKLCKTFTHEMLHKEEEILFLISKVFEIQIDIVHSVFSREEINYKKMKGKFYSQKYEIEIPNELDNIKKIESIVQYMYKHYLFSFNKMKELNLNLKEEEKLLIAEYYAFDSVYFEYEIEYEVIEKCLYQNNLTVIEY